MSKTNPASVAKQPGEDHSRPIVVERIYNAPIKKVWKAITDKDEMKKWYFDISEFKAEPGFEFQFYGEGKHGEKFLHLCKVTEVVAQKTEGSTCSFFNHEEQGDEVISSITFL